VFFNFPSNPEKGNPINTMHIKLQIINN